ncbi:DUF4097 family beta strand repeat-containing protein [Clostridium sp. KNHs205]|jgi:DUF4097 and DUF4098 domain-containing protein YvlB|uniref:DUF4097 family beta strand repeat-containing protein n=1 Tax=Clostridium sp. KNHs205 TaxID=1449050 RepID=UPI00051B73E3|nr:DUF4097 family beta strand repeat-containing protein [Clostridium sp. KNHs205]
MSELQKIIKYAAMAFAIFLAVIIITGIVSGLLALTGVIGAVTDGNSKIEMSNGETADFDKEFEGVKNLYIENGVGELSIVEGSDMNIRVTAVDVASDFEAKIVSGNELKISTKSDFWNIFNWGIKSHKKPRITVYLPEGYEGRNVKIDAGAGNIKIEELNCEELDIDAGVGNIKGYNIYARDLQVNGGVGEINLTGVTAEGTDIDAGVGNIDIEGTLSGKNIVNAGVGEIDLSLTGSTDDYNIKVNPGIGSIYIDGNKYGELSWNNATADNSLDIDGGVGNISIEFKK